MIEFDCLEMLKAIRTCVQKPFYKVGVFTSSLQEAGRVYSDIIDAVREDEEENSAVNRGINSLTDHRIMFKNGSCIKVLSACSNIRGYRFNYVLYDKSIEPETLCRIRYGTEIRYKE